MKTCSTAAEREKRRKRVAELRAEGLSLERIARRVGVSATTVEADLTRAGLYYPLGQRKGPKHKSKKRKPRLVTCPACGEIFKT